MCDTQLDQIAIYFRATINQYESLIRNSRSCINTLAKI